MEGPTQRGESFIERYSWAGITGEFKKTLGETVQEEKRTTVLERKQTELSD